MTVLIRRYEPGDAEATHRVFLRAIRITAAADYTTEQLDAWATGVSLTEWSQRRESTETWVAERDREVVAFTQIETTGYIDMMFVDPSAGRSGVATALLEKVRSVAVRNGAVKLTVNASATARPFFERRGFTVLAEQQVQRGTCVLTNYRMFADLEPQAGVRRWLPFGFHHPERVEWGPGVHLRPIRAADVGIDMPAVMGARSMLWDMYGEAWGWPPVHMTAEEDAVDLQHHADEMQRQESFNYAILPSDESKLYGCLYIDAVKTDAVDAIEAEVSWWLTDTAPRWLHNRQATLALAWIRDSWPFTRVHTPFNSVPSHLEATAEPFDAPQIVRSGLLHG
jgi:GNAT superfamily N-acetyltransferase